MWEGREKEAWWATIHRSVACELWEEAGTPQTASLMGITGSPGNVGGGRQTEGLRAALLSKAGQQWYWKILYACVSTSQFNYPICIGENDTHSLKKLPWEGTLSKGGPEQIHLGRSPEISMIHNIKPAKEVDYFRMKKNMHRGRECRLLFKFTESIWPRHHRWCSGDKSNWDNLVKNWSCEGGVKLLGCKANRQLQERWRMVSWASVGGWSAIFERVTRKILQGTLTSALRLEGRERVVWVREALAAREGVCVDVHITSPLQLEKGSPWMVIGQEMIALMVNLKGAILLTNVLWTRGRKNWTQWWWRVHSLWQSPAISNGWAIIKQMNKQTPLLTDYYTS